ncbi:Alpha/Beta hydrolase protein [Mycena sp. CBHHK59/15]|nr:Alpha/Beta hydrolase protein [Mycena sp. CBHHK59/15]
MDNLNVSYKHIGQTPSHWPSSPRFPAIVYFHGGGLTVGNRRSWFPTWLKDRIVAAGYVFISADYRLLPGATLHDIIDDIQDLFTFLAQDDVPFKTDEGRSFGTDANSIAVAGSSAGGTCAYLAAIHATPKPKAILSLYGMCGNVFMPQYLIPKTEVFFLGRELLDPHNFSDLLYPNCKSLEVITDSPLAYHPPSSPTPGWPANPRMQLARLHEPSLSAKLRPLLENNSYPEDPVALQNAMESHIPAQHLTIFPQFNVTPSFPPAFLCHGTADTAAGVPVRLLMLDEALYGLYFDEIVEFLKKALGPGTTD